MEENLRIAWTEVIVADELDAHLEELGQAKINALLVKQMFDDFTLPDNLKILIPGCGTGQIFDYLSPKEFCKYQLTFSDINQSFLDKLKKRLNDNGCRNFRCIIDDVENTILTDQFDVIVLILVLEQVDWEKGINTIINFNPQYIYLIIQEQGLDIETITVNVKSRDSIRRFSEMADPQLVPKDLIYSYLSKNNYKLVRTYERPVLNQKVMVGLAFQRNHDIKNY
ncbi:MAG: class I SAM-dependent methyltransferase [Candidatus Scalindua sp.]|jgi:SAM-dependent methyltransferase|nr:class I SAM-dependent methyltransferase [Candidatus Scalindua sp.]MBT5305367.1 class I SAM-dependent methyltransferase [Candidatus Scalindua sp.]MBT6052118.1 class I SAM-dependent methyltransferase [Candidatus Scalindua sp.]MBT6229272.1 class I SAM-dependent methyltransferase [Candidatus Scalindua sp.]MBT6561947.1 class I SAM-dependent methyltransferase [Candidatus Scalindua sp.]